MHVCSNVIQYHITMAFNFEVETELKSNAEKVWDALKQHATIFPKAAPGKYDSVEVLEGDGLSVGSVVLFTKTETNGNATIMKQRIELVDEANKTLIYNVIGGNIMKYYKSYKSITSVSDKQGDSDGDGDGALVKCRVEFEKAAVEQQVPDPQLLKTFILQLFHQMDAYLLNTTPN